MTTTNVTLEVSFIGPFGFVFHKKHVVVYAPACEDHIAICQGDLDDFVLEGRESGAATFEYELTGPKASPASVWYNKDNMFVFDPITPPVPQSTEFHFSLKLPRPRK